MFYHFIVDSKLCISVGYFCNLQYRPNVISTITFLQTNYYLFLGICKSYLSLVYCTCFAMALRLISITIFPWAINFSYIAVCKHIIFKIIIDKHDNCENNLFMMFFCFCLTSIHYARKTDNYLIKILTLFNLILTLFLLYFPFLNPKNLSIITAL